jgi:hypothetical protein
MWNNAECPSTLITEAGPGAFVLSGPVLARSIVVRSGVTVMPIPYDAGPNGALDLEAVCGTIVVEQGARVTADGAGFGGGGGGGGRIYSLADGDCGPDSGLRSAGGPPVGVLFSGAPGAGPSYDFREAPPSSCVNAGGAGGGQGGYPGNAGGWLMPNVNVAGRGGNGGGLFGGAGGQDLLNGTGVCNSAPVFDCTRPEKSGADGSAGGYRAPGANGDASADDNDLLYLGSGGGGGGGGWGSGSFCCGGGLGGNGGVPSGTFRAGVVDVNAQYHACGCSGGGGGAGGGAGGGLIRMRAQEVRIDGTVSANGAGDAALGAGYGAGGGVLIDASVSLVFGPTGLVQSLGGDAFGNGTVVNGGTVKLRSPAATSDIAAQWEARTSAGRTSIGL